MIISRNTSVAYAMILGYELNDFLRKRAGYLIAAAYTILIVAVCALQGFRESYFSWALQMPVSLTTLVLPSAEMLLIAVSLSPVFSSEAERGAAAIPACCLLGSHGHNASKLLAGIFFSMIMSAALLAVTLGITALTGLLRPGDAVTGIDYYGAVYFTLSPVWTVKAYICLSLASQAVGASVLATVTLFISKRAKTPATAMAVTLVFLLAEFYFRHFGPFPLLLTEINIWGLFEGYQLFEMALFHGTPAENLAMLSGVWLAICGPLSWAIVRQKVR